jgi:hypothetical protein
VSFAASLTSLAANAEPVNKYRSGLPKAPVAVHCKTRVIWPKLDCLQPNLQR